MSVPRDFHTTDRTGWIRLARHFSNLISPPTLFAALGLVLAIYERPGIPGLAWGVAHGLVVSLLPILFVLWLLRTGRIAELHMTNQRERNLPYLVTISCAFGFLIINRLFNGPDLLACLAAINGTTVILIALINFFWLISIHATAAMAATAIVAAVFGTPAGLVTFPLVLGIAAARIYLQRHTPAQVLAGIILGVVVVWVATLFGCFVVG
jgi:membrane-associated phospholipid phosphatase